MLTICLAKFAKAYSTISYTKCLKTKILYIEQLFLPNFKIPRPPHGFTLNFACFITYHLVYTLNRPVKEEQYNMGVEGERGGAVVVRRQF